MSESTQTHRSMRADAQRNYTSLLKVARVAVAERGADVVLEDVARLAGVAIGTLYRHFYYRSSLLQIYKNGVQRFTSRVAFQTVNGCAAHMGGQVCQLPKRFVVSYQKVCLMGKLACRAIRVTKTREFASINISSSESGKLACRAVSPAFSCVANLLVGNGKPFG